MLKFLGRSFLAQITFERRLKFRDPSYRTFITVTARDNGDSSNRLPEVEDDVDLDGFDWFTSDPSNSLQDQSSEMEHAKATSIVLPFFDSRFESHSPEQLSAWNRDRYQGKAMLDVDEDVTGEFVSRTLDESYYPGLSDKNFKQRNSDQVVSRMARVTSQAERLLLVSQLWLWKLEDIIITAVPEKLAGPGGPVANIYAEQHLQKLKKLDSELVMAWILSETINLFDLPYVAGLREPVLYTFEKAVAFTSDRVGTYTMEDAVDDGTIDKERTYMHEISDVRDELIMIRSVIIQQQEVWNDFWKDHAREKTKRTLKEDTSVVHENSAETDKWWEITGSWPSLDPETKLWLEGVLTRPSSQLSKFLNRIDKIDKDAQRVEEWISWQLDLKSKHAGLKEAKNSLLLSRSVIGFTVITVIFAPLSFLLSLLALPIDWLRRQKTPKTNDTGVYSHVYIAKWLGWGEAVFIIITVLVCIVAFLMTGQRSVASHVNRSRINAGEDTAQGSVRIDAKMGKQAPKRTWETRVTAEKKQERLTKYNEARNDSKKKSPAASHAAKSAADIVKRYTIRQRMKIADPENQHVIEKD